MKLGKVLCWSKQWMNSIELPLTAHHRKRAANQAQRKLMRLTLLCACFFHSLIFECVMVIILSPCVCMCESRCVYVSGWLRVKTHQSDTDDGTKKWLIFIAFVQVWRDKVTNRTKKCKQFYQNYLFALKRIATQASHQLGTISPRPQTPPPHQPIIHIAICYGYYRLRPTDRTADERKSSAITCLQQQATGNQQHIHPFG